jgi:DNA alkylation repair enzyme
MPAARGRSDTAAVEPEPRLAGVQALAQEIDDELRSLTHKNTDEIRAVRREFSKRLQNAAPHVVKELAMLLLELPGVEYRFFGYELIHYHESALYKLNSWELEQLGRGIASWPAADCFGIFLAGPLWRERRIPSSLIHDWARSMDRWWRRIALVSTVPLNSKARGGEGDAHRTLQVCRILERDRDPMVVKALSWALRDLAKRQPRAVRAYLAERGAALSPLVVREVRNKLETGRKNPGRRTKRR